jgi:lactoylglutathione lyase
MLLILPFVATLLSVLQILPGTSACAPVRRQAGADSANSTYPYAILGPDVPADPATTGYFINHFSLNVRNVTESIKFYNEAFGLRHIFTQYLSPRLSVTYIGHSYGGRNGSAFQTSAELNAQKNTIQGLIELFQFDSPTGEHLPASSKSPSTFSHIGMVVPDILAAQERLKSMGANIIKESGAELPKEGPLANAFGLQDLALLDPAEADAIHQLLSFGNLPLMYVTDPDGNVVEIQPEVFGSV